MLIESLKDILEIKKDEIEIKDRTTLKKLMDELIYKAVFEADEERKRNLFLLIKEIAKACGAIPSSIQGLYEEMGRNYPGFTVPAINIRGLTYDFAKTVFRKAKEKNVGALIFEIARSEIGYTKQRPLEYSAVILAAAVAEGFENPIFIQGDHFQLVRKNYLSSPEAEVNYIKGLIAEAIEAEFYNIDIDASTLVDLERPSIKEQQRPNFENTATLTEYLRKLQPEGITISVGGEIGEIGGKNSTPEEARAFLEGFKETFKGDKGLSKLSIQTGTAHGGVCLPDGTLAKVKIDFDALKTISEVVRKEYGLSGCVQHGASTLPDEAFDMFPKAGTSEVHLATGFQNIIYDSKHLPEDFRWQVYSFIKEEFSKEKKEGQTDEQFIYSIRKKGFGPLKKKWWDLPTEIKDQIMTELGDKFDLLFDKLNVSNTLHIIRQTIKPVLVKKDFNIEKLGL
ncbi:MAG: class II fructose-bisphosphate aldolase [Thermodesulfovibrionales bacterium]|nr:class II fructose-bisphosphate aldolase [Thermodesulfovibrionales bacterium]